MPTATSTKQTLRDVALAGKRVLIRVDFNVPQDASGRITDDTRIRESLPTIQYAIQQGAKVILMSHLGRPKGGPDPTVRLDPIAKRLGELLHRPVQKADDCVGPAVTTHVQRLNAGDVLVLENVRFHVEEERNDPAFAKALASLGDLYVNDAFGSAHRAHASTAGVAHYLPAVAGLLLEKEIRFFEQLLNHPAKPFIAILGGAKVSDKIGVITNLLERVDGMLIGGAMAYTFLKAQGVAVGTSKAEEDKVIVAKALLAKAAAKPCALQLPADHVITTDLNHPRARQITSDAAIPDGWLGVDIGPKTRAAFLRALATAKLVVWNGPVGVCEVPPFSEGTRALAQCLSDRAEQITTVIGGGDTGAALAHLGLAARMAHVSTGGGASLEYLEGKVLPGIAALQDR